MIRGVADTHTAIWYLFGDARLSTKAKAVFDLASVAAGFVLRPIAGGVAVGVGLSQWLLIVTTFGAMLMVTGKRFAEHQQLGDRRGAPPPSPRLL